MAEEDKNKLLDCALQAPTSFNIQNWRFVLIENPEMKQKVREAAWDQAQVTDASMTFVMCADLKSWDKDPARYWKDAPEEARNILVPMIKPFYDGKETLQRDEAMRSIGIAAQTIMLAAKSLGYDSCPMIGFDAGKVAANYKSARGSCSWYVVGCGQSNKTGMAKPGQIPLEDVLIIDGF